MFCRFRLVFICASLLQTFICSTHVFAKAAQQQLDVLVPNFPPYTFKHGNGVSGVGVEVADKVFKGAQLSVSYELVPNYGKIIHYIKHGKGDAFLLASQNAERDEIAKFSEPLMVNRWCWYVLNDSLLTPTDANFKRDATISTHFNANTHKWLLKNGYDVEPVMATEILPQMLVSGRVDAVFIAELVFEQMLRNHKISSDLFKKYIEVEKPFGIYISNTYLSKHPEILLKINKTIADLSTKKVGN